MGRYSDTKNKKNNSFIKNAVLVLVAIQVLIFGVFYGIKLQYPGFFEQPAQEVVLALPVPAPNSDRAYYQTLPNPSGHTDPALAPVPVNIEDIEGLQEEHAFVLPNLENSDGLFRESLIRISPALGEWLVGDQLIRKGMLIINDFSQGQRLVKNIAFLKLKQRFVADVGNQGLLMGPTSYQRYNEFVAAVDAMDVGALLALYKSFKPLCQQVFAEFSYPQAYRLDDVIAKAAAEMLAAPIIEAPIELVNFGVRYKFASTDLEALSPVQKQLLRMGPENTRILQNKLRLIIEALANTTAKE
ncbi:MAG: DUF3014 domain-containing protein [Methylococcaceae bacterium]|jgi:hypothetical protein